MTVKGFGEDYYLELIDRLDRNEDTAKADLYKLIEDTSLNALGYLLKTKGSYLNEDDYEEVASHATYYVYKRMTVGLQKPFYKKGTLIRPKNKQEFINYVCTCVDGERKAFIKKRTGEEMYKKYLTESLRRQKI